MNRLVRRFSPAVALAALVFCSSAPAAADPWADSSLQPIAAPLPAFPERMLASGVQHGTVRLMIEVTPSGDVVDALIVAYTHQPFADVTRRAVRRWRFEPAVVGHVAEITLNFETRGVIAIVKQPEVEVADPGRYAYQPCPPERLDRRPQPTSMVEPAYPARLQVDGAVGEVTVEYFIDEQGRVRMPVVGAAAHPLLGGLAIAALKQWQFEPPTCEGRPVLVRAQQSFRFGEPPG